MDPSHSGALSLPGAGRPHDTESMQPRTPEPFMGEDGMQRPPSPPRPKFKLKRRIASNLNAPTQQFLASVAAADVPIPSIEEPLATLGDDAPTENDNMMACDPLQHPADLNFASVPRGRRMSSPRTPAPGLAPSLSPRRYPDWTLGSLCSSVESTPECESSRPSTAVSTQTSASLFSRYSIASEDLRCPGPSMGEMARALKSQHDGTSTLAPPCDNKRRRAKWTAPMTNHLWSTYCLYLRDPKVTPIRFSKSGIPPEGVCCRVAREAKRSWRGANPSGKVLGGLQKSRNATPTGDLPTTFMQWPHTGGATRAHLRDLCKHMSSSTASRAGHQNSQTPTSFGRTVARLRRRRTTPTPSAFSSKEMCMSLALSTCESMQPSGPLAQLTQATPEPTEGAGAAPTMPSTSAMLDAPALEPRRLASPFMAKSYGPSSSTELGAAFAMPIQRQTHTVGAQHALQSPARLTRSRSNTQKRRPRQTSAEPRRTKRPSLGSDLWVRPPSSPAPAGESQAQFSSSSKTQEDVLCVPRTNLAELISGPRRLTEDMRSCGAGAQNLANPFDPPQRLGSPFASSNTSFSFPNRLFKREPLSAGSTIRPFATFQRRDDAIPVPSRDLDGRMSYLDQRLRELRQHTPLRKRSESPF
ncbi:hypothetical protein F5X68DRAFT_77900 [Plectosphaerella plurivora]|uniref:Uncharacterized protein n=1 Tax=Plectosphaerella plurivora TaxID=936078 RepID=A0A9P8VEH2_9PEZI|nr:hypothetical protein F5X68DRAFT_77900 [Plectosphaerella plurivora]